MEVQKKSINLNRFSLHRFCKYHPAVKVTAFSGLVFSGSVPWFILISDIPKKGNSSPESMQPVLLTQT